MVFDEEFSVSKISLYDFEDGQYRPKYVAVQYIIIKTLLVTVLFDNLPITKFHTHTTVMTQFLDNTQA